MKILITGGTGQVGFELQRALCLLGSVMAPTRQELDLVDLGAVAQWLQQHQPDLIVNAAAYTAVDKAEGESELAHQLNAELPEQLAHYAQRHNAWLVHYSSDYVYPGSGETPWREGDACEPLSVYGQTKLAGDQAIQASGCRHLIFRTSWVYSARGHNFMKTMLRLGRERDAFNVVCDQVGAPTPARLIAQVTALALERKLATGLYHLAPGGETSWHGFAQEIFRQAAAQGQKAQGQALTITPDKVAAISTAEYPTPAQRPLNSRLNCQLLEQALGITLPTWEEQLALTLTELNGHAL